MKVVRRTVNVFLRACLLTANKVKNIRVESTLQKKDSALLHKANSGDFGIGLGILIEKREDVG